MHATPHFLASPAKPRPRLRVPLTAVVLACAAAAAWMPQIAAAHGSAAHMVPLKQVAKEAGATVKWDSYANVYTFHRNSTLVRAKPGTTAITVNGSPFKLTAPLVVRKGAAYVPHDFLQQVTQSSLDRTFVIERTPHPLNPLSADEIKATVDILKASGKYHQGYRFAEITLQTPPKDEVWAFALAGKSVAMPRTASVTVLDGKQVIEGVVDLKTRQVTRWELQEGAHGMVLLDDFATVQAAIESSPAYIEALARRGITDIKKVVTTPLTVGYFDNKDGLQQQDRLLKIVSYLDVGDGNYWGHPIENLVAVLDLVQKKIIKVEDQGVVPVPMKPSAYDGSDRKPAAARKPLEITEPLGKNYTITGNTLSWRNWDFHLRLDSRVGLSLSTVTFNDKGTQRKVMYEGSLGGMIVPYGDPDVGWYFKAYLDSGEYGMGTLTSPIEPGKDAPDNAVYLDATLNDFKGEPFTIPNAIAVFERYAGPEYKHQEMGKPNVSTERRELVVRWISTVGNYDYLFDWVFSENGTIGINAGATGIEAVKGVKTRTMQDATAKEDTRYGTLLDHNIVGTTHQHIYNFRLDLDIDGENNTLTELDPVVLPNPTPSPRTSTMQTVERTITTEKQAAQKFDPSTVRLLSNTNKTNKVGNPVSYQLIPYAGGTHPVAKGANFGKDEWIYHRLSFMDKQLWVTRYHPDERFPEGKYPNRSAKDTGLGQFSADDQNIVNTDNVVWLTTGTTHVARAEEWPIMPTEWVNVLLKPWNYFSETPTLHLGGKAK